LTLLNGERVGGHVPPSSDAAANLFRRKRRIRNFSGLNDQPQSGGCTCSSGTHRL
jgi:hypothetical protein